MPRDSGRQDLDAVAIVDGELIAYEVKSRFHERRAGTLTRTRNVPKPRLGQSRRRSDGSSSYAQSTREYVLERVEQFIDVHDDTDLQLRLFVVDLKIFLAQEYRIDDGRIGEPFGPPIPCLAAALEAARLFSNNPWA